MSDVRNIEICVVLRRQTPGAILVDDGSDSVWIPKSLIIDEIDWESKKDDQELSLEIPEWLALQEGLI